MIILEFTQDRIKLLEVARKRQGLTLSRLSKKPIAGLPADRQAGLSDEEVSNAVSDLLTEAGIKDKRSLVICIPRHLFTVRNLKMPSLDDKELRDMAGLQAGKQLPYPSDELVWDFKVIEKRPDGYSDITLILGHRNVIDRYLGILKNAGVGADKIILSTEALLSWYIAASGFKDAQEVAGQIRAVVNIDTSHIDIIILRGNIMEFSRSFPFKNELEEMAEETRKTFHSYEKENSKEISSVILTGIEEKALSLKPLLEGMKKHKAVEYVHPLKGVSMDYREKLSDYFDLSRDISFSCLLGIAYNFPDITMNFLPEEVKQKKAKDEKKRIVIKMILLLTAVLLVLFGIFIKGLIDRKAQFNLISLKIKETEPKVKRLREISENIEIIEQNLDMRGSSVDVIREVFKIVPQEVSISVLDFELEKSLALRGVSADLSSVFKFASGLEQSIYFEDCQIRYAQKRVVKEREFVDFEINCKLSGTRQ